MIKFNCFLWGLGLILSVLGNIGMAGNFKYGGPICFIAWVVLIGALLITLIEVDKGYNRNK